ncbi:Protochlorophyllide reductase B, chloroplastic [Pleurostoma richardsiae]|uniref:Protochlorophyllide reductase B, chloroplastic n=1 Tax=Pleurostoma richardsiae TaxID=41990 RepID=A0AA38REG3_9PEZI|nr:Protochlorophyllide reductase B, chloroplastic [Pleurostoma richardsiae]
MAGEAKKGMILITGANGGLGSAMVSHIVSSDLGRDYHGLYAVRNPKTADVLKDVLAKAPQHKHDVVAIDLGSLASVRETAAAINQRVATGSLPRIRALILNAAFQEHTTQTFSADGFDMTFQVNYLSHFLLTLLLLQSMDTEQGRILVVGSWSHDVEDPRNNIGFTNGIYKPPHDVLFRTTEALAKATQDSSLDDPSLFAGMRRYGASKLCQIMFMHELQARLDKDPALSNISVVGLDPGGMASTLLRRATWFKRVILTGLLLRAASTAMAWVAPNGALRPTSKSAADALRACFDTKTLGEHPRALYLNGSQEGQTGKEARDVAKRMALWRDSVAYARLQDGETVLASWR